MTTGDQHNKLREDRSSSSRDMLVDRQTHTDRETNGLQYSAPLPEQSNNTVQTKVSHGFMLLPLKQHYAVVQDSFNRDCPIHTW